MICSYFSPESEPWLSMQAVTWKYIGNLHMCAVSPAEGGDLFERDLPALTSTPLGQGTNWASRCTLDAPVETLEQMMNRKNKTFALCNDYFHSILFLSYHPPVTSGSLSWKHRTVQGHPSSHSKQENENIRNSYIIPTYTNLFGKLAGVRCSYFPKERRTMAQCACCHLEIHMWFNCAVDPAEADYPAKIDLCAWILAELEQGRDRKSFHGLSTVHRQKN